MPANRLLVAAFSLLLAPASAGCASMSDVVAARDAGAGVARTDPVPAEIAYSASHPALEAERVDELHAYPAHLTAEAGVTAFSWGALVGVFVEPLGPFSTRIIVVVKRKLAVNLFVPFDEDEFHQRLATRLSAWTPQPVPAPSTRAPAPPPRPAAPTAPSAPPPPPTLPPPGTI